MNIVRSEAEEQAMFIQWLNIQKLNYWHTPNSTFTRSWKQKLHNKAMGVQAGIPDVFVVLGDKLVAVEMKRIKGGVTSTHQMKWINILNNANVPTIVAKGHKEAIKFIKDQRNV